MLRWILRCSAIFVLVLTGCSRNPVTGESELHIIPESQEIAIGEEIYPYMQQAEGGLYVADPEVGEYVSKIGLKLASVSDRPNLPYEFVVLNNSIPNAWALPGGKIAINRGLLLELANEAELAAVLAHEIVHSAARHSAKQLERAMIMGAGVVGIAAVFKNSKYEDVVVGTAGASAGLLMLKYSRSAELEADRYGIKYMVAAGYDPQGAVELQKTFLRLSKEKNQGGMFELFSTHPPSEDRVIANEKTAALYPPGGKIGKKEYEKAIRHLVKTKGAYEDLDEGYAALLKSNIQKAYNLALQGIKIEPKEGHLYNLKGKAQVKMLEYRDALESFSTAIDLYDNYFDFYLQRGLLEKRMGNYAAAKRDLDKSNELLPNSEAYFGLGEMALSEGKRELARSYFEMAGQGNVNSSKKVRKPVAEAPYEVKPKTTTNVSVDFKRAPNGNLMLKLKNNNNFSISNITLNISLYDLQTKFVSRHLIEIPDVIKPGKKLDFTTSIFLHDHIDGANVDRIEAEIAQ